MRIDTILVSAIGGLRFGTFCYPFIGSIDRWPFLLLLAYMPYRSAAADVSICLCALVQGVYLHEESGSRSVLRLVFMRNSIGVASGYLVMFFLAVGNLALVERLLREVVVFFVLSTIFDSTRWLSALTFVSHNSRSTGR